MCYEFICREPEVIMIRTLKFVKQNSQNVVVVHSNFERQATVDDLCNRLLFCTFLGECLSYFCIFMRLLNYGYGTESVNYCFLLDKNSELSHVRMKTYVESVELTVLNIF